MTKYRYSWTATGMKKDPEGSWVLQSADEPGALQPIFTVCGICQRKATVTSQSEVKLLGIICERTDCPGRPSQRTNSLP